MKMRFPVLLAAAATLALAACEDPYRLSPTFGDSVRHNMRIQMVNPDPIPSTASAEDQTDGDLAASAYDRYRTGKVKALKPTTSTDLKGARP
ncbi:MAG: hypothetical protein ACM33T_14325 [Solirubrobacterales bacterium]